MSRGSTARNARRMQKKHGVPPLEKITWSDIQVAMQAQAIAKGDWAGHPNIVPGQEVTMEPRFPRATEIEALHRDYARDLAEKPEPTIDEEALRTPATLRNQWFSYRHHAYIQLVQIGDLVALGKLGGSFGQRLGFGLNTMAAVHAWDLGAEFAAMGRLREAITEHAFKSYVLTGGFLETSPRSKVTYWFRRLRPTIAMAAKTLLWNGQREGNVEVLAALCLHPIGFYKDSWAGVMVPTDDIIAHLFMMRGDEHRFWRHANQHEIHEAAAGV